MPNRDGTGPAGAGGRCGGREQMQGGGQDSEHRTQGGGMSKCQAGNRVGRGTEKRRGRK